ncbi:Ig-like domain-containing protein [Lachnospiraceae bacterium ZAX-1]
MKGRKGQMMEKTQMKSTMKKIYSLTLSFLLLFSLVFTSINVEAAAKKVATESVLLNKTEFSLVKGKTFQLTATVAPANAKNKTITWTSSKKAVATVSKGKVKAKKNGTATITATVKGTSLKATATVTVVASVVTDLDWSDQTTDVNVGKKLQLKPTFLPYGATANLKYYSEDPNIATVNSKGVVTGVKAGDTYIKVVYREEGNLFVWVGITVKDKNTISSNVRYIQKITADANPGFYVNTSLSHSYNPPANGKYQLYTYGLAPKLTRDLKVTAIPGYKATVAYYVNANSGARSARITIATTGKKSVKKAEYVLNYSQNSEPFKPYWVSASKNTIKSFSANGDYYDDYEYNHITGLIRIHGTAKELGKPKFVLSSKYTASSVKTATTKSDKPEKYSYVTISLKGNAAISKDFIIEYTQDVPTSASWITAVKDVGNTILDFDISTWSSDGEDEYEDAEGNYHYHYYDYREINITGTKASFGAAPVFTTSLPTGYVLKYVPATAPTIPTDSYRAGTLYVYSSQAQLTTDTTANRIGWNSPIRYYIYYSSLAAEK